MSGGVPRVSGIRYAGDGLINGNVRTDFLQLAKGNNYWLPSGRGPTVNNYFESIGDACNSIRIERHPDQTGQAIMRFTPNTEYRADFLDLHHVNALDAPLHYAGHNSVDSFATTQGWTFIGAPNTTVLALSRNFLTSDTIVCTPGQGVLLEPALPENTDGFSFQWNSTENSPSLLATQAGNYALTITLPNGGCVQSDTITLRILSQESQDWFPDYEFFSPSCPATATGLIEVFNAIGGGISLNGQTDLDLLFEDLPAMDYVLAAEHPDLTGCFFTDTISLVDPPEVHTNLPDTLPITSYDPLRFNLRVSNGQPLIQLIG